MLDVRALNAWYGKSHVLQGVDLHVGQGEIVAVLGRNGAGRSTLLRALMGHVRAGGSARLRGRELLGLKPFEIARAGLGYVPEDREVFARLTVRENLMLGVQRARRNPRWGLEDFYAMFPILREREHDNAGVMSGGEQQMLTLARTLMGDPDLVMIDEPTEGLAPRVVEQIAQLLEEIARRGVAVLLVEQKLDIALRISRRVCVLGHGCIVHESTPQQLQADAGVCREWLGV
jgi:branched-chain amino acid transport system ATP-binding protein